MFDPADLDSSRRSSCAADRIAIGIVLTFVGLMLAYLAAHVLSWIIR